MSETTNEKVDGDEEKGVSSRARDLPLSGPEPEAVEILATETQSQSVVSRLRSNPALAQKAERAIEEAMDATRPVWSKETESFIEQPDHKTRMVAVELYLHNTVGLPVQRTENLNINKTVPSNKGTPPPAALAEMKRMIARAEAEERKKAKGGE